MTGSMTPRAFGTRFHHLVKLKFLTEQAAIPAAYAGVDAEVSVDPKGEDTHYGARSSPRLDVVERIPADEPEIVCNYEVKTGDALLQGDQLLRQAMRLAIRYPRATIYIIEIKPNDHPR